MEKILKAFAKQYAYPKMYKAVKAQSGLDGEELANYLLDVSRCSCGAAGGFHGFIYYTETTEFYRKNKKTIQQMLSDTADSLGESIVQMVKQFKCFKDDPDYSELYLEKQIFGKTTDTYIMNYLTWFAFEDVAFRFNDFKYEYEH